MAEYKGIKAILTKFYKEIKLSAGNGISISDKFVVSISDELSSLISDIQLLVNTNKNDISSIKSVNDSQTNSIISLESSIDSLQSTVAKIVFPVGFVYTQYPGTPSPATLGLNIADNCAWVNISSKYQGAFFRAYYGSMTATFSDSVVNVQAQQLLSHTHTINHEHTVSTSVSNAAHVYFTGSKGAPSANANTKTVYQLGGNSSTSVSVSVGSYSGSSGSTGSSELRPRNVSIQIWQVQEV